MIKANNKKEALLALSRKHPEVRAALEQREVPFSDRLRSQLEAPLQLTPPALRPYQRDALLAWCVAGRRGTVVLPTGAGKTHVALAAMGDLARSVRRLNTRYDLSRVLETISQSFGVTVVPFLILYLNFCPFGILVCWNIGIMGIVKLT